MKVRGTVEAPQLLADITARGLRWQELSVAQVRVEGDIKSTDQIAGKLDVRVEQISQPDVNINLVTLNAKGSEKQHELQLRIQGEPVSGSLIWQEVLIAKKNAGRELLAIPASRRRSARGR